MHTLTSFYIVLNRKCLYKALLTKQDQMNMLVFPSKELVPTNNLLQLGSDLGSSLRKLLAASNDSLWRTGWVYTRVQHSVAFLYNGQVVLDAPLRLTSPQNCRILSIKPLVVPASSKAYVELYSTYYCLRLLCTLEGKYLAHDRCHDLIEGVVVADEAIQHLSFSCHIPNATGRGFIEVVSLIQIA
ncbi:hypothetical protein RIF29_21690 [Crotalaria pallida]|uniref:Uncharacterized protein n=1 Tax=Crotalaria pallida TaxID=3830 RepID=A0AAN9F7T8_CROPI